MTTTSSKSPSPRMTSTTSSLGHEALRGLGFGSGAGLLICLGAWLSPFAAADRPALALAAVILSLPVGCIVARRPRSVRDAGGVGMASVVAALALSMVVSLPDPALWLRTASWCLAAGLLGAAVGSMVRGAAVIATCGWLFLNGLPFFFQYLPAFRDTGEAWALNGCPWLGFSADAFGGDPLRRTVIYMGQWTELSGATSLSMLQASTLWLAAVPAFASLILATAIGCRREQKEDTPVVERAGA